MIVTPSNTGLGCAGGRAEAVFFSHGLAQDALGRIAPLLVLRSTRCRREYIRQPLDTVSFKKSCQLRRWNDRALTNLASGDIPGRDQLIDSRPGKAECIGCVFYTIRQWRHRHCRGTSRIRTKGFACLLAHYRIHLIFGGQGI
jgi:hypothetical protein